MAVAATPSHGQSRWRLELSDGNAERTRMILLFGRTFLRAEIISWLATRFNDVLGEDRGVLETSDPKEAPPPGEELSVETDGPTLHFRKYYYRELRGSSSKLVPTGRLLRGPGASRAPGEEASVPGDAALAH